MKQLITLVYKTFLDCMQQSNLESWNKDLQIVEDYEHNKNIKMNDLNYWIRFSNTLLSLCIINLNEMPAKSILIKDY